MKLLVPPWVQGLLDDFALRFVLPKRELDVRVGEAVTVHGAQSQRMG